MSIVTASADHPAVCDDCGAPGTATVTEALAYGHHRRDLEFRCSACGAGCEEGDPSLPEPLRAALLTTNGPTVLRLATAEVSVALLMKILRTVRSLSPRQAPSLADELRAAGLAGTRVEMEMIAQPLRAAGIADVALSRPDEAGRAP